MLSVSWCNPSRLRAERKNYVAKPTNAQMYSARPNTRSWGNLANQEKPRTPKLAEEHLQEPCSSPQTWQVRDWEMARQAEAFPLTALVHVPEPQMGSRVRRSKARGLDRQDQPFSSSQVA